MKLLILLTLVAAIYVNAEEEAEEWKPKTVEEIKAVRTECLKEHPLSEEQINKLKNLDYADEEAMRQYLMCTGVKLGIFSTDKGYNADRILKQFKVDMDETEVLDLIKGCMDANEENSPPDVWAYRMHKCMMSTKIGEKVKEIIKQEYEKAAAKAKLAAEQEAAAK